MYPGPWYGHGHHVHEGLGWGGWLLWVLFMVALWALVIMAAVWLVRSFTHRGPLTAHRATRIDGPSAPRREGGTGTVPAEQILAERFAHGQIDEHEYRARLGVLRGEQPMAQASPPAPATPPVPPTPPPTPPSSSEGTG